MATYEELFSLYESESAIRDRVNVAIVIKAQDYLSDGAATAPQKKWAANAAGNPSEEAKRIWPLILAANKGLSVAAIQGATDAAIQTNVDAITSNLADGIS